MQQDAERKFTQLDRAITISMRIYYHEIMNRDFTGVYIDLLENDRVVESFANYDRRHFADDEIYGNQQDTFVVSDIDGARQFILSNPAYSRVRRGRV